MTTTITGASLDHVIGPNGLLSIRLRDGRARLRAVDGDVLRIRDGHGRDLADMFAIELGDGNASFRAGKRADRGLHGGHTPDVEIDLPRTATVVIEAGSADIEVDGLAGDQRYRTASGDMSLRAVSGRVAVDAVSGDIDISATGQASLTIRTVSGDVELRAATLTALEAATTSGDLSIAGRFAGPGPFAIVTVSGDTLLAPAGDVRIEMATLSGDLRSKLGGRTEGGRGNRSLTVGAGGPTVSLRSLSGDLLVAPPTAVPAPAAPEPPTAPEPPRDSEHQSRVEPATPVQNGAIAAAYDDARLRILRSLERGEIDVAEAGQRLEALDGVDPLDPLEPAGSDLIEVPRDAPDTVDPGTETARFDPNLTTDA
jgi:Putative adhesin